MPPTRAEDRKISPAPTPDDSLRFPLNLPESHLLHLDIFPHLVCEYANNAEEHNNNKSDDGKGDGHLSSVRYRLGIGLGALCTSVVPMPD